MFLRGMLSWQRRLLTADCLWTADWRQSESLENKLFSQKSFSSLSLPIFSSPSSFSSSSSSSSFHTVIATYLFSPTTISLSSSSSSSSSSNLYSSSRSFSSCPSPPPFDWASAKPFEEIPGPKALPLIGTLHHYLPFIGKYSFKRLHRTGSKKLREFGPIVREPLLKGVNLLLLFDPKDIETMFAVEGRHPQRRSHLALQKYRLDRSHMYNSGGLLPSNGQEWWDLRSPAQKVLSRPQSVQVHLPKVNEVSCDFIRLIEVLRNPQTGLIPDFLPLERRLFLELTMAASLNVRAGCIAKDGHEGKTKEAEDLIWASEATTKSILHTDNGLQLWRKFKTPLYKQLTLSQDTIYRTSLKYVEAKEKELKSRLEAASEVDELDDVPHTVLEHFLLESRMDKKDIVSVICDTLLAGVDTGAYALSYALYNLAVNPDKQQILAEEAYNLLSDSKGKVTSHVLSRARYLKAVVKETFRLRPVAIGVGRLATEDLVIRGYRIPKDTVIVTQNQVTSRLPEYFPEPDNFLPERWFSKDNINPFVVLPFGHGPRSCIGRRMAEQNLHTILFQLIHRYEVGWQGGHLDCYSHLINEPDLPLDFTFTPRSQAEVGLTDTSTGVNHQQ